MTETITTQRVRIRFSKFGAMKYVGHLDMMRFFMNAIRRASLPIKYTGGFHPHPVLSFAQPLGVGVTSTGEYMDLEFDAEAVSDTTNDQMLDALSVQMVEGVTVDAARILAPKEKNAMASVEAADYMVFLKRNPAKIDIKDISEAFHQFLQQPSIMVTKKTKKGVREFDVAPFIYQASVHHFSDVSLLSENNHISEIKWESVRPGILPMEFCIKDTDPFFLLSLSAGSSENIKPELVLSAFFSSICKEDMEGCFAVHRFDLMTRADGRYVSLGESYGDE